MVTSENIDPGVNTFTQGFIAADAGGAKPVLNIGARWHGEGYFDQTEESSKFRQVFTIDFAGASTRLRHIPPDPTPSAMQTYAGVGGQQTQAGQSPQ
jgi:hypothetical protein